MKRSTPIANPNGPVLPRDSAPGTLRTLTFGERYWELSTPGRDWGGEWTWRRTSFFGRTWSLASESGTHLLLCEVSMLGRLWRAEASTGGWTLKRSWVSRTVVTDDEGTELMRYEPSWWGRGPILPAGGAPLKFRRRWPAGYALESAEGHELLVLGRGPGFFRPSYRLTLSDAARSREDLLPLLALCWLLVISARRRHAH
jgi:hypothetical protein